jgi:hypothetical protein
MRLTSCPVKDSLPGRLPATWTEGPKWTGQRTEMVHQSVQGFDPNPTPGACPMADDRCECGHDRWSHPPNAGVNLPAMCREPGCGCRGYKPAAPEARPGPPDLDLDRIRRQARSWASQSPPELAAHCLALCGEVERQDRSLERIATEAAALAGEIEAKGLRDGGWLDDLDTRLVGFLWRQGHFLSRPPRRRADGGGAG